MEEIWPQPLWVRLAKSVADSWENSPNAKAVWKCGAAAAARGVSWGLSSKRGPRPLCPESLLKDVVWQAATSKGRLSLLQAKEKTRVP